jgi:Rrf2 family protein
LGAFIIQFNQATDYAFRVVLFLGQLPAAAIVRGPEIAVSQNIPSRFLLKIMRSLAQAGIIKSFRGVAGGYALAKSPAQVSLYDVIAAMEGPVVIQRCLSDPDSCTRRSEAVCPVHQALDTVQVALVDKLRSIKFAELAPARQEK